MVSSNENLQVSASISRDFSLNMPRLPKKLCDHAGQFAALCHKLPTVRVKDEPGRLMSSRLGLHDV